MGKITAQCRPHPPIGPNGPLSLGRQSNSAGLPLRAVSTHSGWHISNADGKECRQGGGNHQAGSIGIAGITSMPGLCGYPDTESSSDDDSDLDITELPKGDFYSTFSQDDVINFGDFMNMGRSLARTKQTARSSTGKAANTSKGKSTPATTPKDAKQLQPAKQTHAMPKLARPVPTSSARSSKKRKKIGGGPKAASGTAGAGSSDAASSPGRMTLTTSSSDGEREPKMGKKRGRKATKNLSPLPSPKKGERVLCVSYDMENSLPSVHQGSIFEHGWWIDRVEVVGDDSTPCTYEDIGSDYPQKEQLIEPSGKTWGQRNHELYWKTREICKKERADLNGQPDWETHFPVFREEIERARVAQNCDSVCFEWWNGYSCDHKWLWCECIKHGFDWPEYWIWGFDPLRAIRASPGHKFKTTRKSKLSPDGRAAPAGNKTEQLGAVYLAATNDSSNDAHSAGWDTKALSGIKKDPSVTVLRWGTQRDARTGISKGVYQLKDRVEDPKNGFAKVLKKSETDVSPDPPSNSGWVKSPTTGPGSEPPCARPYIGTMCGPTHSASGAKESLADYWDLHYTQNTKEQIAKFTNYYAVGQPVKLAKEWKGGNHDFVVCKASAPGARTRWVEKPGQTQSEARESWGNRMTANHVDLAFAVLQRCAALGHTSMYAPFCTIDEGSLRDACITNSCTRDNFAVLWQFICFMNYATATFNDSGRLDKGGDPIARVHWFFDVTMKAWESNYTMGRRLALDEFAHKGARSRFCDIGMYIANKPIPHHVDWIMIGCSENNYPAKAHVFTKDGTPMADLVFEKVWNSEWTGKGHLVITDSRYGHLEFFKNAHRRGCGAISTVKIPKKKKATKKKAEEDDDDANDGGDGDDADDEFAPVSKAFPMTRMSKSAATSVSRGHMNRMVKIYDVNGEYENTQVGYAIKSKKMALEAASWLDARDVGFFYTDYVGNPELDPVSCTRFLNGAGETKVPSFPAQIEHGSGYGGIDKVGRGAVEYGIDFQMNRWYLRIITSLMNINSHCMWVLAKLQLKAEPDDALLKVYTNSLKGCTARKRFILDLTRKVIERASARIRSDPTAWNPNRDRSFQDQIKDRKKQAEKIAKQPAAASNTTPSASSTPASAASSGGSGGGSAGRPRKAKPHTFKQRLAHSNAAGKRKFALSTCSACYHRIKTSLIAAGVQPTSKMIEGGKYAGHGHKAPSRTTQYCGGCLVHVCMKCQSGWKHVDKIAMLDKPTQPTF